MLLQCSWVQIPRRPYLAFWGGSNLASYIATKIKPLCDELIEGDKLVASCSELICSIGILPLYHLACFVESYSGWLYTTCLIIQEALLCFKVRKDVYERVWYIKLWACFGGTTNSTTIKTLWAHMSLFFKRDKITVSLWQANILQMNLYQLIWVFGEHNCLY